MRCTFRAFTSRLDSMTKKSKKEQEAKESLVGATLI